ncbi:MAG: DUF1579 domain-containing protein [Planctomycetaceae bacterium]
MNTKSQIVAALTLAGFVTLATTLVADPAKKSESKNAAAESKSAEGKLPPGWTPEDLQAYIEASTPGKMQEYLGRGAGEWTGKSTMWMAPGGDPVTSESRSKVTSLMDGRYMKCEMEGEIPGMGPYQGLGYVGYDNVARKFISTWIDNHSTGFMIGEGSLSKDEKVLTWNFTFTCPITKKPTVMRQIETITSPTTKTLVMYGPDPKSGKEFKMMSIELTRKQQTR